MMKRPCVILTLFGCLMIVSMSLGAEITGSEIEKIRIAIKNNGASWIAGENEITRLSSEQRKGMLGGLAPSSETPDHYRALLDTLPLPTLVNYSWGNAFGHNWMTSIRNQGQCGSCWAFAACGMYEARKRIQINIYDLPLDVSEQNMVSCWGNGCNATTLSWTLTNFLNNGSPDEVCFPYQSGNGTVPSCESRCPDWQDCLFEIYNWSYTHLPSVAAMETEIQNHGPLAVWMTIYTDFYTYNGGVYVYSSGSNEGGHFVVIYGWNDGPDDCWLAKNSWGTSWGETGPDGTRGWFRIRKGTNEAGCETWVYSLVPSATAGSPPVAVSPNDTSLFVCDLNPKCLHGFSAFDQDNNLDTVYAEGGILNGDSVCFTPILGLNTIRLFAIDTQDLADTSITHVTVSLNHAPEALSHPDTTFAGNDFSQICLHGFTATDQDGNLDTIYSIGGILAGDSICFTPAPGLNLLKVVAIDDCGLTDTAITTITYLYCQYMIGDFNSDSQRIGGDVTYGVRYFKGLGNPPPDSCAHDSVNTTRGHWLYVAADVNGDCNQSGADITRLVAYFKGYASINTCRFFPLPPMR